MALNKKKDELYLLVAGEYDDRRNIGVFDTYLGAKAIQDQWNANPDLPSDMKAEITTIAFNEKPKA